MKIFLDTSLPRVSSNYLLLEMHLRYSTQKTFYLQQWFSIFYLLWYSKITKILDTRENSNNSLKNNPNYKETR